MELDNGRGQPAYKLYRKITLNIFCHSTLLLNNKIIALSSICFNSKNERFIVNHTFRNAMEVRLHDISIQSEEQFDRLNVVLYDDSVSNIISDKIIEVQVKIFTR